MRTAVLLSGLLVKFGIMLLVASTTAGAVEQPALRVVGTITMLARSDVGVGRRIAIKTGSSQSVQGMKPKVMEFFLDEGTSLTDRGGKVTFTELTIGLSVRIDYVKDTDGRLRALIVHIQRSGEDDAGPEALSL